MATLQPDVGGTAARSAPGPAAPGPGDSDPALRGYRFALADLTAAQEANLRRHAGAARWAYNYAHAAKLAAHEAYWAIVKQFTAEGADLAVAMRQASSIAPKIPRLAAVSAAWRAERGDSRTGTNGVSPWHHEVSSYAISTGFRNADAAWTNYFRSRAGQRAGARVGLPRFKAKGRAKDVFTLFHDLNRPVIRLDGYRRVILPRIGSLRLANSNKRLSRLIDRGQAVVKSATVTRGGTRWYVSLRVQLTPEAMRRREQVTRARQQVSRKRQHLRPEVGVEWGVRTLATLSDATVFANPRHGERHHKVLARANRALARKPRPAPGRPSSRRRRKAVERVARVHHRIAEARRGTLHQVTTRIAINYPTIAVRQIDARSLTRTARRTVDKPGRQVAVRARFNRLALDAAPGEMRRQLEYKAAQWGTVFRLAPADLPSSQICSRCGWRDPSLPLAQVTFRCGNTACGSELDREVNAARNILHHARPVAPDSGETLNARRGSLSPPQDPGRMPMKREDPPPRRATPGERSPGVPHPVSHGSQR